MYKIYINNFEQFFSCMNRTEPVFLEKVPDDGFVKNELYGVVRPMIMDNAITIFRCLKHEHGFMTSSAFERMIINLNFNDKTMVTPYSMDRALELYRVLSKDLKLFVIDDLFHKYTPIG